MAKRDNHKAALVLAEAAFLKDDLQVTRKFKISLRTLYNWRTAAKSDRELAQLFTEAFQELEKRDWAVELTHTLAAGVIHLKRLILGAKSSDPETIQAVTGAVLGMAEIAMTREMIQARISQGAGPQLSPRSQLVSRQVEA